MAKTSFSYKLSRFFFVFINYKRPFKSEKKFKRYLAKKKKENKKKYIALYPVIARLNYERKRLDGMDYFIINKEGKNKILFIPGGSYIDNPTEIHWLFVEKIVKETDSVIYMPIYAKLPEYNYYDAYGPLQKLYSIYQSEFMLIADSAGAGLGLGLYYKNGENAFKKTILISPWIDINMQNKEMKKFEPFDPILSISGLKKMGEMWSLGDDNMLVNALKGPVDILDNIYVFSGTHEVFCPDIRLFVSKCNAKKNIYFYEFENMNHGFVIHPIKESKEALRMLIKIIKS